MGKSIWQETLFIKTPQQFNATAQSPNPLNLSIKNNTDNVNQISCQDKYSPDPADGVEKKDSFRYKNKMVLFTAQGPYATDDLRSAGRTAATVPHGLQVKWIALMLISLLMAVMAPETDAKQKLFEAQMPVVAIDPGHGGNDNGAKGPNGVLEKTITLNLARIIAQQLEADYRVVLTRDDDYGLNIPSRTAAANHANSDIFISLHTGSSFVHDTNRSAVYFYRPFQGSALVTEPKLQQPSTNGEYGVRWDMIQTKYRAASEKLAKHVQSELTLIWQPSDVGVKGIPLLVLQGADMPAVAIEIGNLANANAEKQLTDTQFLSRIAEGIVNAITAFLADKPR